MKESLPSAKFQVNTLHGLMFGWFSCRWLSCWLRLFIFTPFLVLVLSSTLLFVPLFIWFLVLFLLWLVIGVIPIISSLVLLAKQIPRVFLFDFFNFRLRYFKLADFTFGWRKVIADVHLEKNKKIFLQMTTIFLEIAGTKTRKNSLGDNISFKFRYAGEVCTSHRWSWACSNLT